MNVSTLKKKKKSTPISSGRYAVRYGKVAGDVLKKQIDSLPSTVSILFFNGLVSLLNGISTFVGYLMPKPFS